MTAITTSLVMDGENMNRSEQTLTHYQKYRNLYIRKAKEYRLRHPDKVKAYQKTSRLRRREEIRAYQRQYKKRERLQHPGRHKQNNRKSHLKVTFGITLVEYDRLLETQGYACALCQAKPIKNLCIDHSHSTGKIRGLLCGPCNRILGIIEKHQRSYLQRVELYLFGKK